MRYDIVHQIWQKQPDGFFYLPLQNRNYDQPRWVEGDSHLRAELTAIIWDQPHNHDAYFTPLSFDGPRQNHRALEPIYTLFADLDEANPQLLGINPSIAWETSPGMFQGVWFLSDGLSLEEFNTLNKSLTYWAGADRGGWHASKVLRIPGSVNWKRGGAEGRVLWVTNKTISSSWLYRQIDIHEAGEGPLPGDCPPVPSEEDAELALMAGGIGLGTRHALQTSIVDDRSVHIWKVAKALKRDGVAPDDAFRMIWYQPWNKHRQMGRPQRLWADIVRAYG